ncbi:MAG: SPFH domain-containing protein [Lachnospira sp.]
MAQIADIIKYEGDNSTFIWKHPNEDFNSLTQLIVHESQEAVFFMNGQALDLFGPGRYTLETQNIPIIGKFLNRTTGDKTPFHCEVYFINQTVQMGLKWGTDSKVRFIDPESGLPLELGASGDMNLKVCDSRKLLIKLVGTMKGIAWEDSGNGFTKSLQSAFRPLISTAVKSNLTAAIKENNINILEVDEYLTELSETLRRKITPGFEEYGITIPQFYLTTVVLPEDDPNFKKVRELHTISIQKRMIEAEADIRAARAEAEAKAGTAQARAEAEIVAAKRQAELERQTTQTEVAKREAERTVIGAQAEAQAMKTTGFAEAEVMRAKGYDQKDVIQAEVQKAYAEGMGNMGSNGGSAGGGVASDMVSMMAGMKMAGVMMGQMDNMMGGMGTTSSNTTTPDTARANTATPAKCVKCGADLPENAKFCFECGEKVVLPVSKEMVVCPECGSTVAKGRFCLQCGYKFVTVCSKCGNELPAGAKFCLECGEKL